MVDAEILAEALKGGIVGEEIPVSPNPVIGGYSGGTPGGLIYAAEGTDNGKVTDTEPTTQNDANTVIGLLLTATTIQFNIGRADSVHA